jgi:catechol 2,3-dioxygenase-like lactoylglutathione lyase family enzyme
MQRKGVHHLGLATLDFERTIDFYVNKLGWKVAVQDIIYPPEGGRIKHVFLDTGDGSYFAFMSPEKVPGVPVEFATDINSPQKLPPAFYHFAMWVDSHEALEAKREELISRGVEVTPIIDHDWAHSIYFRDPNGLQLEYCATVRELTPEDAVLLHKDQPGFAALSPEEREQVGRMMRPQGADAAHR